MAKSLQDHLKEKRSSTFVGREQYLELFKQNLGRSIGSDGYYFIFSIHGQGGVGKTTLINKFKDLTKEHKALLGYTNEDIREIPDLLSALAKQFNEQGAPLKKLEDRYRTYLQEKKRLEADPEAPKSTWAFGGKMLARGGKELAKHWSPDSSVFLDQINTDAIGEQIGEWVGFLKKKISNNDEVELLLNPVEVLTPLFLEGLNELANRPKICFFFDTYENTDIYLDEWLRQLLEGKFGDAPANILITIAGREPLNPNQWVDFAGFISTISLEPFSEIEARNYLAGKKVTDHATIDTIIRLSGGLPILLEILAEKAPNSPDDVNDRCETAVERFLKWIEDPILRNLALHAALPNLLNEDIVKRLLPEGVDVTKLFDWLRSNPFVYKRDDHWAYHAYVRELMLRYQKQLSIETWEKLNIRLAEYYLERAKILDLEENDKWKDLNWLEWMLEYHYHMLLTAPKKAIKETMRAFARVFGLHGVMSTIPWSEIIFQSEQIMQETSFGEILRKGLVGWYLDREDIALQMFNLINSNEWLEDKDDAGRFYFWEAYCAHKVGQISSSLQLYQKAIELKPDDANIHNNYGIALYAANETHGAIEQYRKAIELKPNDSFSYNNLGNALQNLGDLSGAYENYKKAIELNLDSASAYNNLGNLLYVTNDLPGAIQHYKKSIEIKPNDTAFYNLGVASTISKDISGAIAAYQKSIELNPRNASSYNNLGNLLQTNNDIQGAIKQYQTAIEVDPTYADAYNNLGAALKMNDDLAGAIAHYKKAISLNPNYIIAHNNLGTALQDINDLPGAILQFQKAIEQNPKDATAYNNLGIALQAINDLPSAIQQFQTAIELDPENARLYYNLGLTLQAVNDLDGAIIQYKKSIDLNPNDAITHNNLGIALQAINDLPGAIAQFLKADELKPDDANICNNLGTALKAANDLSGAIAQYQKAIKLNPENDIFYNNLGNALKAMGNLPEAIEQYQNAIELNQDNATSYNNLGNALKDAGNITGAIEQYRKTIELIPNSFTGYNNLGNALKDIDDMPGAIKQYKKAIELQPDDPTAYYNLGITFQDANELNEAIKHYKKAIELNPNDANSYYNMGLALKSDNNLQEAILQFKKSIEINPNDPAANFHLAIALKETNSPEAIRAFQKMIELTPNDPIAYINLGVELQEQNDVKGAIEQYEKAIELEPNDSTARYNLGIALKAEKKLYEAIIEFKKVLELKPDNADVWHNLGWTYLLLHQLQQAEYYFIKSWELWDKNNSFPAMNLGHVELFKANKEKAIEWYRTSIQLNENKEDFIEAMNSDFTDLQMETHGINRDIYDSILLELRTH